MPTPRAVGVVKTRHIIDTVRPTFQTGETWCGPAVVQAVLAKLGFSMPQDGLAEAMNTTAKGTKTSDIERMVRWYAPEAYVSDESLEVLYESVKRGASVILCIKAYGNGHYVCLVGDSRRNWFFADPSVESGYGYVAKAEFPRRLAVRWALVVGGRSRPDATPVWRIPE